MSNNEAIPLKPDFATAFNNRVNAYYGKGDYEQAIRDYNEAIRLKPDYANALSNRSNVFYHESDYDRAIQDYSEAIHLNHAVQVRRTPAGVH